MNNNYFLVKKILDIISSNPKLLILIDEKTNYNDTPLNLAERKQYVYIINLLKQTNEKIKMNSPLNSSRQNEILLNKAKPKGLINIHGSCYLNTVLQCLFHIKPLSLYFLEEKSNFYENSFAKAYLSVIVGLIDNTKYSFEPLEFKKALIEYNPNYNSFGCDPKDVIIDFLFYMNKELSDEISFQLNNKINKCNKKDLFDYNKGEFERTKTIISELFGWFEQTNIQCNCGGNTFNFIPYFYFSFNLQKVNKYDLNLIDCFKDYFNDKYNISFTCQQCFKKKKGIQKKRICVLPKYLIIILDRGKDDKFKCQVHFDYSLDLNEVTEQIENEKYNTKYELIGATFLLGSSGAGHTVAYCKHFDGKYYLFNDNTYKQESLNKFKNNKVFLLFYERKN
jgi:ubiquitin C-terminal hydrolase